MDVETPIHFYRDNRRVEEPIHFATYRQSRGPKPRNKPLHLTPSHFRRQQCSTRSYIGKKPQVSHRSHIAVEMAQPEPGPLTESLFHCFTFWGTTSVLLGCFCLFLGGAVVVLCCWLTGHPPFLHLGCTRSSFIQDCHHRHDEHSTGAKKNIFFYSSYRARSRL